MGQGSNTFVIPPNNGISDIILSMALPAGTLANLAICRGWGYALIKQISFRYGGSSQYFLSGQQVLQSVLEMATDSGSRDAILSLGGNASAGSDFATQQKAYVFLPLPHSVPSVEGKLPPLPSDLLTQQCLVTVELYPLTQVFSVGSGGSLATIPAALSSASFQCGQVLLEDQGNALARRVDMTSHALSYPVTFRQQEVQIQLGAIDPGVLQQVTLTGKCCSCSA